MLAASLIHNSDKESVNFLSYTTSCLQRKSVQNRGGEEERGTTCREGRGGRGRSVGWSMQRPAMTGDSGHLINIPHKSPSPLSPVLPSLSSSSSLPSQQQQHFHHLTSPSRPSHSSLPMSALSSLTQRLSTPLFSPNQALPCHSITNSARFCTFFVS